MTDSVPSKEEMGVFYDALYRAKNSTLPTEMPAIEATYKICHHLNRASFQGVEQAGYFVYEGVKVFIEGRRQEAERRDNLTCEEKVFQGKT